MIMRCVQEAALCPPRARQEGHPRRFTVIHGATPSALDLCSRRSSGRGHFLCKEEVSNSSRPLMRRPLTRGPLTRKDRENEEASHNWPYPAKMMPWRSMLSFLP